jgi:putative transcriptional regulator
MVEILGDGTTRPLVDTTDYARLAAMSDEEIEANALADEDNPPLTEQGLARLRRVPDPKRIRERLRLTQK